MISRPFYKANAAHSGRLTLQLLGFVLTFSNKGDEKSKICDAHFLLRLQQFILSWL
jgi:hypothetical protein